MYATDQETAPSVVLCTLASLWSRAPSFINIDQLVLAQNPSFLRIEKNNNIEMILQLDKEN